MDWLIDGGTDSDRLNDMSDGAFFGEHNDRESSTDNILSSDLDNSRAYNQKRAGRRDSYKERRSKDNIKRNRDRDHKRDSVKTKRKDVPSYEDSSFKHILGSDDFPESGVCSARGVTEVEQYERLSRTHSDPRLRDLRREEYPRRSNSSKTRSFGRVEDETAYYYSSSSSVKSDIKSPEQRDYSNNHSSDSHKQSVFPSNTSSYHGSEEKVSCFLCIFFIDSQMLT